MSPADIANTIALNQPGMPVYGGGVQPGAYGAVQQPVPPDQMAALQAYEDAIAAQSWTSLMGQVTTGVPAAGTPTLAAQEATGTVSINGTPTPTTTEQGITGLTPQGNPTLAAQQQLGYIGGAPTTTQEGITGLTASGQPTLASGMATGWVGGAPTTQEQQVGLTGLQLAAGLNGPENAFTQQAVLHGLDSQGLSRAVDAISGQSGPLATFQAPQAQVQPNNISNLISQAQGNPGAAASNAGNYMSALPAPNKINGTNWMQLDPDTQNFLLGAYQKAGFSANDVTNAVQQGLPQFKAPVAAPGFGAGAVGAAA